MEDKRNELGRCPYCNKKLSKLSIEYANKHIRRCKNRLNPYIYSERGVGRPSKREIERIKSERDEQEERR